MRKKNFFFVFVLLFFLLIGAFFFFDKRIKAQETDETTFPVNEAGISAYYKTNAALNKDLLSKVGDEVVKHGESYIIVKEKNLGSLDNTPVFVYIGLDGWMVAYLPKETEESKIIVFKDKQTPLETTLERGIKKACEQMQIDCSSLSSEIKYYHFQFPQANKMTFIAEEIKDNFSSSASNDFYVTVPGTLYSASYIMKGNTSNQGWCFGTQNASMSLKVDDLSVVNGNFSYPFIVSGTFDTASYFRSNTAHHVVFSIGMCTLNLLGLVALIYGN